MARVLLTDQTDWADRVRRLPFASFLLFGLKQAWCALFGGLMLAALVLTHFIDLPWLSRFDWLFVIAVAIQIFMVAARLETRHELYAIVAFHLIGLAMELFKTSDSVGSWSYPGEAIFEVGNVPLFSGFMYAAVGSYIARSWRVMHLRMPDYPNRALTVLVAIAIYVNFFSHHYIWDYRWLLFIAIAVLWRLKPVYFTVNAKERRMPIVVSFFLIALFIWIAENVSTFVDAWRYPDQEAGWQFVSAGKLGSWTLLMVISFVMVEIMYWLKDRYLPDHR